MHTYSNSLKNTQTVPVTIQTSKHHTYADLFAAGQQLHHQQHQQQLYLDSPGTAASVGYHPHNSWGEMQIVGAQTSSSSHSNYASQNLGLDAPPPSLGQSQTGAGTPAGVGAPTNFIADQICRMINGKLSLTHNQNTQIPLGNLQDTLFNSEYLPSQQYRSNEYFESVQKYEKDVKQQLHQQQQLQQQQQQQLSLSQQQLLLNKKQKPSQQQQQQSQSNLISKDILLHSTQKSAIQIGIGTTGVKAQNTTAKPKKQLTINTAEEQPLVYNFPNYSAHQQQQQSHENLHSLSNQIAFTNPRSTVSSAKPSGQKNPSASTVMTPSAVGITQFKSTSTVAIPKIIKNNLLAPAATVKQQVTGAANNHKQKINSNMNGSSAGLSMPNGTSSQSAIMKQLSPKYQQQIKLYDGVSSLFSSQQQQQQSQQPQQPSNSQSPNNNDKHRQTNSTSPATEMFFLSPNHPKSQPQSTKNLVKSSPKHFDFPSSSASPQTNLIRNAATAHQTPSSKSYAMQTSSNIQQQQQPHMLNSKSKTQNLLTASTTTNASQQLKNMSINLIVQKQQSNNSNNISDALAKNLLLSSYNSQNMASSAKLAVATTQQSSQKNIFQQSSTRDSSEVVQKLQQQQDLNAIFQRTSAVLRNFQQEKELWGEEKNMLINEIMTLRSRISFYQESCNQKNQKENHSAGIALPTNNYFENRTLDFND